MKKQKDKQPWPPDKILEFFGLTREEWDRQEEEIIIENFWNHPEVRQRLQEEVFKALSVIVEEEGL